MPEAIYRSQRMIELQLAYQTREQNHMELNLVPYAEYDLTNFQTDIAYNPPRVNPGDSRIVSGYVREKDQTIVSVIQDMNFQPRFCPFDKSNKELVAAGEIFTAKVKKVLLQCNFKDESENMARLMVSRGNVFVSIRKEEKWHVRKIPLGVKTTIKTPLTWKTVYEKVCDYCTIDTLPNTAVFPTNIRGEKLKDNARMYTVRHYPIAQLAQRFKGNPRWLAVPKSPTMTVPDLINGIWGDYYLKQPLSDYGELITMESEVYNEFQEWVNGVQMHPVQMEGDNITGYPLSEKSPNGEYTICKGDYERIPFFFFSKSNPDKNFVKEEELNEVMRLMVLMLRQKTQPPIGNNTNRVLNSNFWLPNMITPDIKKEDISILTPHQGIGQAEFSFWKMLSDSIDDSSVSKTLEGNNNADITATQYQDQKKESLKKLGLCLDRFTDFLRQVYMRILDNEISYLDQKVKQYKEDGSFIEAYQSFTIEDSIDGRKGNIKVNLMDDISGVDKYAEAQKEAEAPGITRSHHAKPKELIEIYKRMRDQMYMEVVSEPEGEQVTLLGMLFNLLTQYSNLKGGDTRKVNFDYLETIIAENSGFDSNKLFLDEPLQPPQPQQQMGGNPPAPGTPPNPTPPQQNPQIAQLMNPAKPAMA